MARRAEKVTCLGATSIRFLIVRRLVQRLLGCIFANQYRLSVLPDNRIVAKASLALEGLGSGSAQAVQYFLGVGRKLSHVRCDKEAVIGGPSWTRTSDQGIMSPLL